MRIFFHLIKGLTIICFAIMLLGVDLSAQVFSDKVLDEESKLKLDSMAEEAYPYALPIWGAKAVALGFDIPYSAGLSINFIRQESQLSINNLFVGVNNSQLVNLDEVVRFNEAIGQTSGVNLRPDIWLFPFLNIYGIFARSKTSTEVNFGIWVPNGTSEESIFDYGTTADFEATSLGFGVTPTVGIGGGFMALDMNFTWTDIPELDKPTYSFVFGPRFGKSFNLKPEESSIAVWVGGFRVALRSETSGQILLSEVLPEDGDFEGKVNNGISQLNTKQGELDEWYDGLSPSGKALNLVKYNAAAAVLAKTNDALNRLADASQNLADSSISYSLDKKLKDKWNFIVGSQYQINKHWMVRAEVGFLSSRKQLITGLQYRFGL